MSRTGLNLEQRALVAERMLARMMPVDQWIASLSTEERDALVRVFGKSLEEIHKERVEAIEREISDPSPTLAKGHPKIPGSVRFGY